MVREIRIFYTSFSQDSSSREFLIPRFLAEIWAGVFEYTDSRVNEQFFLENMDVCGRCFVFIGFRVIKGAKMLVSR